MKAKDAVQTGALRLLLSSVKNKQIEIGHELTDQEFLAVVTKEVKQRQDSITQFSAAGRDDLAKNEQAELNVLSRYLPPQLDEQQIMTEVDKAISSTQAQSPADMGKVMMSLSHLKSQADMAQVSNLVRQKLSN